LRSVLGICLGVEPEALIFEASPRERPVLRWPSDGTWLHFSLSHSGDLALVAVARDRNVGADVERVRNGRDLVAIARRALGNELADGLAALPEAERTTAFYRAWVRAEARGKCLGTGLVELEEDQGACSVEIADVELRPDYTAAVASEDRVGRLRRWLMNV
jgi:4'-phosphopantetheinyl transferase